MRIIIAATFALLAACGTKPTEKIGSSKAPVALNVAAVYNFDSVKNFLTRVTAAQEDTAKKLFLSAIDLLKNKKDAQGSVVVFERSLSFYPGNKAYYELGNALLEMEKYDAALKAFDMAERLNYNPLGYVLFKKACCITAGNSSGDNYDKDEEARKLLQYAVENGFTDREKLLGEPMLKRLNEYGALTTIYNEAMAGYGDPATILWDGFSSSFKSCSFPLTINMEVIKGLKKTTAIGYDYEKFVSEMRDYKFSRDVGNEFFYYAKVASTPAYETVVYGSRSYDYGPEESLPYVPAEFYIASYDKKGKLLDKLTLAGNQDYEKPFKVATLLQNGNIEIKDFKNVFEKNTDTDGYENNKIVKSELIKTAKYKITDKGMFVEETKALAMR